MADNNAGETTSDHSKILKQVEFYFSDNNLPYDKFLWTESKKNDGWIPIKTIHSFKRMQIFQPFEEVVAALKESPQLLEVSEDGLQVRRKEEIKIPSPEEGKERLERTVYAKGFGEEKPTSQVEIEAYFGKFGEMNQVRMRRTDDGTFKSSVFAEFKNAEDAKKFVEQEKAVFEDNELLVMSKQAYVEMKSEQHNFADKHGRRKPRFNAFKQMKADEYKSKSRYGRGKGRGGNQRGRGGNKRRAEDEPASKKQRTDDTPEVEGTTETKDAEPKDAAPKDAEPKEATETKPETTESK